MLSRYVCSGGNTAFSRIYTIERLSDAEDAEAYYQKIQAELEKHKGNETIDAVSEQLSALKKKLTFN